MKDFEKLGVFYLGRIRDESARRTADEPLLYDAKDLTTHAVCVGMTGSGKTGLCVSLLEEAAIDGIPTIAIDPKGDLGNLLLAFPSLAPADFRPWIDEAEAQRQGASPDEYAARTAEAWKKGLADWGQDAARIERFCAAAERTIYTPGSTAGRPLAVLRSLAAPPRGLANDQEALRDRVAGVTSGLLSLAGIEADPLRSREHILIANLIDAAWRTGRDLEIGALIREIQSPPFDRLGVVELESFFPARERFDLAMRLNNLLASPGASAWTEGDPLDIGSLLYTSAGRPRLSIVSIAHLGDAERMFFVSVLLSEVLAWMRSQPGTTSLRAILYMDEVFGYFPPTANPPSKTPMLTLLKQARAYGVGVVLATQNPVDLDYKGLANAGTWWIGRLQTERDRMRVLDGLEGASAAGGAAFDRARLNDLLSGLEKRTFLMHDVHEDAPVVFESRWALSYLRGPLTRAQIQSLTAAAPAAAKAERPQPKRVDVAATQVPVVEPGVPERFVVHRSAPANGATYVYRPALYAAARLHYVERKAGIDHWQSLWLLSALDADVDEPWEAAKALDAELAFQPEPDARGQFASLPAAAARAKSFTVWQKALAARLYRDQPLSLWRCDALGGGSMPGETEAAFRVRLGQSLREKRDLELARVRQRHAKELDRLRERIRTAEDRAARERSQATTQKLQTVVSVGATLVGALLGRKALSASTLGRAATAARGVARAAREGEDVAQAEGRVEDLQKQLDDLEQKLAAEVGGLAAGLDPASIALEELKVSPRKSDIQLDPILLVWTPWILGTDGTASPNF